MNNIAKWEATQGAKLYANGTISEIWYVDEDATK